MTEPAGRRASWLPSAAAAVMTSLLLGGCSGSTGGHVSDAVTRHFRGLPVGMSARHRPGENNSYEPWAAWAGRQSIYVMTWGSSSCPKLPTSVSTPAAGRVVISTAGLYAKGTACTADLAVTTSVVRLPSAAEHARTLVVDIDATKTTLT